MEFIVLLIIVVIIYFVLRFVFDFNMKKIIPAVALLIIILNA